jgi:protein-disulfide isomerase
MNLRGVAFAIVAAVGLLGGMTAGTAVERTSFSTDQTRDIEKIVHDYLVAHPEVMIEVMSELEAKQASQEQSQQTKALADNRKAIYSDPTSFVAGNPKGDVTIVEFFDYQCGYCKHAFAPLMDVLKNDGKVRLILKEFPILGPESVIATHAAIAAGKQGKYFEFHQALYRSKGALTDEKILQIAQGLKLDINRLKRDMADPAIEKTIAANEDLARALAIKGTPGFIIGGKIYPGALKAEEFAAIIKDTRESCGANC